MTKRIFLIIVIVFLCIFGLAEIIPSYLVNHHTNGSSDAISYYTEFAKNRDNRKLIFAALIFSLIPVLYMIFAKTKKIFILLLNYSIVKKIHFFIILIFLTYNFEIYINFTNLLIYNDTGLFFYILFLHFFLFTFFYTKFLIYIFFIFTFFYII